MENEKMKYYEMGREVPQNAKKNITGGNLNGKTSINPMWRIKKLTEMFGAVGQGWYIEVTGTETMEGAKNEVMVFVHIKLYVKYDDGWSKPIVGTGGSTLVDNFKNGLKNSDEGYKMALTDAVSVACKNLGIGASVYWENDYDKYTNPNNNENPDTKQYYNTQNNAQNVQNQATTKKMTNSSPNTNNQSPSLITEPQAKRLFAIAKDPKLVKSVIEKRGYSSTKEIKRAEYDLIVKEIEQRIKN